jgi:hypothetical protein
VIGLPPEPPVNAKLLERLKKRHAQGKFWVTPYWVTRIIDGVPHIVCTVAQSRAARRHGKEVAIPVAAIEGKTDAEQRKIIGPHLAQALVDLGLGWMVKKAKVAADMEEINVTH